MSGRADLWIAALVMLLASAALGAGAWAVAWSWSERRLKAWAVGLTVVLVVSGPLLSDSTLIASLPVASIVIWANPIPLFVGALVGIILRTRTARWRRALASVAIGGVAIWSLVSPVLARPPRCGDGWNGDVCLQMQASTCAPAAAVTLLAQHGIRTTEREMADLCLTSEDGTVLYGLCRGLRIKTRGTPLCMRLTSGDADDLRAARLPALVHVTLTREMDERDPRYARDWGWIVGVTHTVIVFGFVEENGIDLVEVGDPAIGRERWEARSLADLHAHRFITLAESAE
ncbi:MAG: cysteine peptidase family C39 domain-containing protein [Planctomycetota bacterium]|jgi:hypothetical protein